MPSWHAQGKCDLYRTGFVNEEVIPTSYCANVSYNKHCHLSSKKFPSFVAFPVLRYIDTYRINFLSPTYRSADIPTMKVFPASLSWCSSDWNNSTNFRLYHKRHQGYVVAQTHVKSRKRSWPMWFFISPTVSLIVKQVNYHYRND